MVGSFQKEKKALPGESRNLCTFEKTQPNQEAMQRHFHSRYKHTSIIGSLLFGCPRPVLKNTAHKMFNDVLCPLLTSLLEAVGTLP